MFASRRAFWAVAPQAASSSFVARAAAPSCAAVARLYSTETQPAQADSADSSTETAGSTDKPSSTPASRQPARAPGRQSQLNKSAPSRAAPSPSSIPSRATVVPLPATVSDHVSPSEFETAALSIDWASSYHGISSRPVSEEQFKVLMAPLDDGDIEVKPDGVIYLPEIKYRRRLNAAFGPMGWGMIPRGEAVVGDNIVTREYALIVGGRFVAQAQGENQYFNAEQLPSAVEGCKSNALMRCCKDLGIASELWDPTFIRKFRKNNMESRWVEHATTNKKRQMWFRKGLVEVAYPYKLSKGGN